MSVEATINERHNSIINGEPTVPYEAYEALRERHTGLTKQYSNLQNAHNKIVAKWRAAKAHIKTWEDYHARCKARERAKNAKRHEVEDGRRHDPDTGATGAEPIANGEAVLHAQLEQSAILTAAKPAKVRNNGLNSPSVVDQPNHRVQEGVQSARSRPNREASVHKNDETNGLGNGADEVPTSKPSSGSQTTAGKYLRPDELGYSSDQPVIISERSVKKRKRHSNVRTPGVSLGEHVQQVGSVAKPIHVKSENNSSSPAPAPARRGDLVMQDSLDLDDVGARLITPRKRRRLQELLRQSQSNPSAADADVRVGLAEQATQPIEGSTEHGLAITPDIAAKSNKTKKQDSTRLFQGFTKPSLIGESTGSFKDLETHLKAKFDDTSLTRKDAYLEESPSLQRPKQPLRKLNPNILHPRRAEPLNSPAGVVPLAAPSTPENGNDDTQVISKLLRIDDQPVRAFSAPPKVGTSEESHVLRPANPNAQIQPRTSEPRASLKGQNQKSRRDRIADRMPLLTEDGENFSENSFRRGTKAVAHVPEEIGGTPGQHTEEKIDVHVHRRLVSLLDEPSPEKALLSSTSPIFKATKATPSLPSGPSAHPRRGDHISHGSGKLRIANSTPNCGPSPTGQSRVGRGPGSITGNKSVEDKASLHAAHHPPPTSSNDPDPGPIDPEDEPLRARPLRCLRPDDFKINPDNNQGLDYAFTEVVRNHDQRRCLPGCTRPSCCGSVFRKLIELGGLPTPRTAGLWSSSPPDENEDDTQEQANTRLLKEYLGADYERRLKEMSEAQRKEALLDAKTRAFADRHGRHRQAFERRATPPGFWRTDMPSTQEAEMDREEAKGLERRRVEEMYREAMREGGRWRFRDE